MIKFIIVSVVVFFLYTAEPWKTQEAKHQPLFDSAYVAVYGRNTCSYTQKMLKDLKNNGVNYHYFSVDEKTIADKLHDQMRSLNISTKRYNLPVVDTNGHLNIRPTISNVLKNYR